MASFEDYDEFGNYIGADLDSDNEEEEELPQNQFQPPPQGARLEGYDDEPMPGPGADEGALMEIDGSYPTTTQAFLSRLAVLFL
jgi:U5 small nuclear ribonucleoprotein component